VSRAVRVKVTTHCGGLLGCQSSAVTSQPCNRHAPEWDGPAPFDHQLRRAVCADGGSGPSMIASISAKVSVRLVTAGGWVRKNKARGAYLERDGIAASLPVTPSG
jgi:hypothetical protein